MRMRECVFPAFGGDGPFLGPLAKTVPSRKAVLFNEQILAEAKPGQIWDCDEESRDYKYRWSSILEW